MAPWFHWQNPFSCGLLFAAHEYLSTGLISRSVCQALTFPFRRWINSELSHKSLPSWKNVLRFKLSEAPRASVWSHTSPTWWWASPSVRASEESDIKNSRLQWRCIFHCKFGPLLLGLCPKERVRVYPPGTPDPQGRDLPASSWALPPPAPCRPSIQGAWEKQGKCSYLRAQGRCPLRVMGDRLGLHHDKQCLHGKLSAGWQIVWTARRACRWLH